MSERNTPYALFDLPDHNILVDGKPYYQQVFEEAKQEFEEMSEQQAEVGSLGLLKDLIQGVEFKGTVSRQKRIDSGELSEEEVANFHEIVVKSYVPVKIGAHLRCVDGRAEVGFNDAEPSGYFIGPQIQGGTIDVAAARRLRKGMEDGANLISDVEDVVETTNPDVAPGGHTDTHAKEGEFGCGAVKTQEAKLDHYIDSKTAAKVTGIVNAVYGAAGKTLPAETFDKLSANSSAIKESAASYYADKPQIVDYISKFGEKAKQTVDGTHAELEVWLNFVENTTLNTGKLNAQTDGKKQAFGLDVWYILKEYEEDAPFILADAVATLIELTDGSLEVKARTPVAPAA